MLRATVHRLLKHRHFWRDADFDELSEIYITSMFRSLSVSLTGIFVPLYMLRLGYPVIDIIYLQVAYFTARSGFLDLLSGVLVSKIGPKHTILAGYFLLIISTAQFLTLPHIHWPLWLMGGIWGGTSSFFCIPFHVDFSKIKHKLHGGQELGYVNIMNNCGGIVGPLVSGIVATLFGGQYIFLVAAVLLLLGGMPLLRTAEQVPLNQQLNFRMLGFKRIKRDLYSFWAYGVELSLAGTLWPIYLGLFVLAANRGAYARLGILASASVLASMAAAFAIGKLIDRRKGRPLLRYAATFNAGLHLFRPFVKTYPIALLINLLDNGASVTFQMPYTKGMYDVGDELDEHRVAYFTTMEWSGSVIKLTVWLLMALLSRSVTNYQLLTVGFVLAGAASMLIMTEKFRALDPA